MQWRAPIKQKIGQVLPCRRCCGSGLLILLSAQRAASCRPMLLLQLLPLLRRVCWAYVLRERPAARGQG